MTTSMKSVSPSKRNLFFVVSFLVSISLLSLAYYGDRQDLQKKFLKLNSGASIEISDCSGNFVGSAEARSSSMWTEKSAWMNLTDRAEYAVKTLNRFGHLGEPGSLLVDMGSGFQALRAVTPETITYAPVDLTERIPNSKTSLCDLNNHEFPFFPGKKIAAFAFLGSFEYILDKFSVLHLCRQKNAPVILHYQVGLFANSRTASWVAPYDVVSFKEASKLIGYEVHFIDAGTDELMNLEDKKVLELRMGNFIYLKPV